MPSEIKNILYFSSFGTLRWGGQRSLAHLVTRIDRRMFRPVVVLPTDEDFADSLRRSDVEVLIEELPKISAATILKTLCAVHLVVKWIRAYGIHLVHTDGPLNTLYGGIAARLCGVPVAWHIRTSDHDPADRLLYLLSSKVILVAGVLRKRFNGRFGKDRFVKIYNGVDVSEFCNVPVHGNFRADLGIPEGSFLISCIGRVEPRKGQLLLLDACGKLGDQAGNVHLCFAGQVVQTDYAEHCMKMARLRGMQNRVSFTGHVENIVPLLQESDLVVLPSRSEAFPRVIIEAMAAGKPVIATNVGGSSEAVEDGVSGFIVPPEDVESMMRSILALYRSAELRNSMGSAGRERCRRLFSVEMNVQQTEALYREMLGIER